MRLSWFLLSTLLLTYSLPMQSALLVSFPSAAGVAQRNPVPSGAAVRFSIGSSFANCFNLGECTALGEFNGLDASSTGQLISIGAAHPSFAAATGLLTNGVEDIISAAASLGPSVPAFPGGGSGILESFFGTIPGPDLVGRTTGLITFRLDSVTFSQMMLPDLSTFPNVTFVPHTQVSIAYTLNIYDAAGPEVPEPGTAGLALAAAAAAAGLLRRRR